MQDPASMAANAQRALEVRVRRRRARAPARRQCPPCCARTLAAAPANLHRPFPRPHWPAPAPNPAARSWRRLRGASGARCRRSTWPPWSLWPRSSSPRRRRCRPTSTAAPRPTCQSEQRKDGPVRAGVVGAGRGGRVGGWREPRRAFPGARPGLVQHGGCPDARATDPPACPCPRRAAWWPLCTRCERAPRGAGGERVEGAGCRVGAIACMPAGAGGVHARVRCPPPGQRRAARVAARAPPPPAGCASTARSGRRRPARAPGTSAAASRPRSRRPAACCPSPTRARPRRSSSRRRLAQRPAPPRRLNNNNEIQCERACAR